MKNASEIEDLAAEYVLGTLDGVERAKASVWRSSDPAMDMEVTAWEKRLSPLNDMIPLASPSPELLGKIEWRVLNLPVRPSTDASQKPAMRRWLSLAMVASLAFMIVTATRQGHLPFLQPTQQWAALLQNNPSEPLFVVSLNQDKSALTVHRLATPAPAGKDYELWIIPEHETVPRPLGVMASADLDLPMLPGMDAISIRNATLAVSVEPAGGSPTGAPTGPVIVTGKFSALQRTL